MNVLDRARIANATFSYDMWLDLRGVPGRRRRDLRRELRANLGDATSLVGSRNAVRGLGSTREMAAAADVADPTRPHWAVGFGVGCSLLAISLIAELLATLSWLDGAIAAAPENRVSGAMTFFPGSNLAYSPSASGFNVSINLGWVCLLIGLIAFVLAARPWRLLIHPAASRSH
ncbi:hypothetical protein E3T39_04185 [Cryobacterium suzukii]|uniref:Uncharacterized protein n=1 Tax=Cryobacterium suzukii TaxID=1259198 RepID=A0A4R9AHL6_9MICO|nr:hypothetical protein [Cryobacterium suzukii]TFD62201.1 hypothetical protein E3T39_04185 [Cryobacterium suzukii]